MTKRINETIVIASDQGITESWMRGSVHSELYVPVRFARLALTDPDTLDEWEEVRARRVYDEIKKIISRWKNEATPEELRWVDNKADIIARLYESRKVAAYPPFLKLEKAHGITKMLAVLVLAETAKAEIARRGSDDYYRHSLAAGQACIWLQRFASKGQVATDLKAIEENERRLSQANKERAKNAKAWREIVKDEADIKWNHHPSNPAMADYLFSERSELKELIKRPTLIQYLKKINPNRAQRLPKASKNGRIAKRSR